MCNINCLSKQMKRILKKWSFLIPAPSHRYTLSTTVKSQWRAASWDYGMQDVCLYKGNERCLNKAIQNYTEETWSSLLCHSFVAWDETALRTERDNMQRAGRRDTKNEARKWQRGTELQITTVWNRSRVFFFSFFPFVSFCPGTGESGRLRSNVFWQRRDIGSRGHKSLSLTAISRRKYGRLDICCSDFFYLFHEMCHGKYLGSESNNTEAFHWINVLAIKLVIGRLFSSDI